MDFVHHVIFHALHAWDQQDFVLHALRVNSFPTAHVMTSVQDSIPMADVWLHAPQDFISHQTQFAVHVDHIVKSAAAQHNVQDARQTCTLTWVIVWLLVLQIPLSQQTTPVSLAIFLAEPVKAFPLNVSRAQQDTRMIQD